MAGRAWGFAAWPAPHSGAIVSPVLRVARGTMAPRPLPWKHGWVGDEEAEQFEQRREGTGARFAQPGQAAVDGLAFG